MCDTCHGNHFVRRRVKVANVNPRRTPCRIEERIEPCPVCIPEPEAQEDWS